MIRKPTTARGSLIELVLIVAVAIGFALIFQAAVAKPYEIPSSSMEPTLDIGQRVIVNRLAYDFSDPTVGDIIVFHPPAGSSSDRCGVRKTPREACPEPTPGESDINFIKRIVATPGDTLSIAHGHPVVNGVRAKERFIRPCRGGGACNLPQSITIPPDHYFVMGDNRGSSDDSRFWGPVPRDWIIGKAVVTYWPPDRVGLL